MTKLERRYRRLLAVYPRDHRERHGEEMLAVMLADAGGRTSPGRRATADLLWGALRLHLRRVVAADGGIDHRDVLAIVSLLAPVALLAGATSALHELGWWVRAGFLGELPFWRQVPDLPVWGVWLVVALLAVFGMRRSAAVGAWLGVAGFLLLAWGSTISYLWTSGYAGLVLLGLLAAVALTWSAGPARGRELARWRSVVIMAVAVAVSVGLGTLLYGEPVAEWARFGVLVVGAVLACAPRTRAGRRAALVLTVPIMTAVLWQVTFPFVRWPETVVTVIYYAVPVVVLLAVGGLPRRLRWTSPAA